MIKGFLIDPKEKDIKEVEIDELNKVSQLLNCSYVEYYYLDIGDVLIVDEEGFFKKKTYPFSCSLVLNHKSTIFVNKAIVVNLDNKSPWTTYEELRSSVNFIAR